MIFEKLNMPTHWKEEFTKYPNGSTLFESVSKWVQEANNAIDAFNNERTHIEDVRTEVNALITQINATVTATLQDQTDKVDLISFYDPRIDVVETSLAQKMNKTNVAEFYLMSAVTAGGTDGSTDDLSVIRTTDNKVIVIDCGEVGGFNYYDAKLSALGITKVDYFLVTHSHSDHIGNAVPFINKYKPSYLYCRAIDWTRLENESPNPEAAWLTRQFHNDMISAAVANGTAIVYPQSGDMITFNAHERIKIIYSGVVDYNDYNNDSMAFQYENNLIKVLFMGDLLNTITDNILHLFDPVDVVKLGHHGTAGTSNWTLLNKIKAPMAILNNQFINTVNGGVNGAIDTCNRVRFFGVPFTNKDNEVVTFSIVGNTVTHNMKDVDNKNRQFNYWDGAPTTEYYFVKNDGNLAKDEFIMDGFNMKYFTVGMQLQVNVKFIPIGNTYYYCQVDGVYARDKWILHTDGKYYYMKNDYKTAVNEKLWINGIVYTFDSVGTVTPIPTP